MTSSKTARKAAQKRRRKAEARHNALAGALSSMPEHIKLVDMQGVAWQRLVESSDAYKKARGIVSSLVRENRNTIKYKFHEDLDDDQLRDKFLELCVDDRMRDVEEKFASKFGAYWQPDFSTWAPKVWELYKHTTWNPDGALNLAVMNVTSRLRKAAFALNGSNTLAPLSIEDAYRKVTKGRNSGYPYFDSKWASNPEMLEYYIDEANKLLNGEPNLIKKPFILFKRIQVNGQTPKMRPIQGAPKEDAIASKCFTDPMVDLFKSMTQFCGFNGGVRVGHYAKELMETRDWWLSADFSAFDANAQHLVSHAFSVLKALFPKDVRTQMYLDNTLEAYQHVKLITPLGLIYSDKVNGVASGCGFTSVIGTLCNAIATEYWAIRTGHDPIVLSFGDDIVIGTNAKVDLDEFSSVMAEVGMECNQEKQEQSQDRFNFLGYYHFRGGSKDGIFPIMRLAPGFRYREAYFNLETLGGCEPDQALALAIACRLDVLNTHPQFQEVVDFAKSGCPYLTEENLIPMLKYRDELRVHRTTRGSDFPVVRALFGAKPSEGGTSSVNSSDVRKHEEVLNLLLS